MDYVPTPKFGLLSEDEWLCFAMQAIEENEDLDLFSGHIESCIEFSLYEKSKGKRSPFICCRMSCPWIMEGVGEKMRFPMVDNMTMDQENKNKDIRNN